MNNKSILVNPRGDFYFAGNSGNVKLGLRFLCYNSCFNNDLIKKLIEDVTGGGYDRAIPTDDGFAFRHNEPFREDFVNMSKDRLAEFLVYLFLKHMKEDAYLTDFKKDHGADIVVWKNDKISYVVDVKRGTNISEEFCSKENKSILESYNKNVKRFVVGFDKNGGKCKIPSVKAQKRQNGLLNFTYTLGSFINVMYNQIDEESKENISKEVFSNLSLSNLQRTA